ncbi:MAG: thiamine phosphate synthase, partial [Gammaproteobacteria bacterium]
VVTGGHARQTNQVVDSWQDSTGIRHFATPRHPHTNLRGTGCRLATLIACHLVQGSSAGDAVVRSLMCLNHAIGKPVCLPAGHGYPAPQALTPTQASLPTLLFDSHWPQVDTERCFRPIPHPIGLYPIVDSLDWLERLQHYELALIQLRLKKPLAQCRDEIRAACELARKAGIRLIVNDHWQAAIEYGAFGVHLGQDDLAEADLDAIAHANLALGVSTHDYFELVRALALSPSYVALGHIFPTPTKVMPSAPQGLQRLAEYVKLPLPVPTVAIGGIDLDNARSVADTGVDGVAVVRAVTQAPDLDATIRRFQSLFMRRK